jgi:hypothetical protein
MHNTELRTLADTHFRSQVACYFVHLMTVRENMATDHLGDGYSLLDVGEFLDQLTDY